MTFPFKTPWPSVALLLTLPLGCGTEFVDCHKTNACPEATGSGGAAGEEGQGGTTGTSTTSSSGGTASPRDLQC